MNPHRTKSSRIELEERLERVEELLCSGLAPERVQAKVAADYIITTRQARNYIGKVYARWRKQATMDAPHRREKLFRMTERFYARAVANKQYGAAVQALGLLAKMSGAFTGTSPSRETILAELGPVPDDPTQALVWMQRVMLRTVAEILADPTIDPERRARYIGDLGGKIGMTHAKALVEAKLDTIEQRVSPPTDDASRLEADTTDWPANSRLGKRDAGDEPVRRPGAETPTGEDG
jgi:hypothetical protein